MAEEQDDGTVVLPKEAAQTLYASLERLLKSRLYLGRLRRSLINGRDPKVLTTFLVLDDVVLAVLRNVPTSVSWEELTTARVKAFLKSQESAVHKLDVRGLEQMLRLSDYLRLNRNEGETAEKVFEGIYFKHDY